jgi:hypothetical protein
MCCVLYRAVRAGRDESELLIALVQVGWLQLPETVTKAVTYLVLQVLLQHALLSYVPMGEQRRNFHRITRFGSIKGTYM